MCAYNVVRKFRAQLAMPPQNVLLKDHTAFLKADAKFGAAFGKLDFKLRLERGDFIGQ
jgi:hypothetical protein